MLMPLKIAAPPDAARDVVPPSNAPEVPVPVVIATAIVFVAVDTVFPSMSCTRTTGAGEIAVFTDVLVGFTEKASFDAEPDVRTTVFEIALVNPVLLNDSVRVPFVPRNMRLLNVARPDALVVTAVVPLSVPPPLKMVTFTDTPLSESGLPFASSSSTTGDP